MCLTLRLVIKVLFLLGCQTLYVMFQLSRAAHQLLGCVHTLSLYPRYEVYRGYIVFAFSVIMFVCLFVCFSVLVENIDLRKLNGLELHLKMDQLYSPIY